MENAKLKQISSYEENISMRKELTRVIIDNQIIKNC